MSSASTWLRSMVAHCEIGMAADDCDTACAQIELGERASYRSGYGQAKADMLSQIANAIAQTHAALQRLPTSVITHPGQVPPGTAQRIALEIRLSELRRMRAVCKAMGPKE